MKVIMTLFLLLPGLALAHVGDHQQVSMGHWLEHLLMYGLPVLLIGGWVWRARRNKRPDSNSD